MRILFAICNIGFGHVSRSLALIKELEARHEIFVAVGKPYARYLRELGYNAREIYAGITLGQEVGKRMLATLLFLNRASPILLSLRYVKRMIAEINPELIVSDTELVVPFANRFSKRARVVMITHQPNIFTKVFRRATNALWHRYLNRCCDAILVPDVVGIPLPERIGKKTKIIGPLFHRVKRKVKFRRKTVVIVPSFASVSEYERLVEFAERNKEWDFVFLGQSAEKRTGNVILKKKENVKNPCEYISAAEIAVVSGYSALMEAVYYRKPVFMIPTQFEQECIAELGEASGVLVRGSVSNLKGLENLMEDKTLRRRIVKNQKRFHRNGVREAVRLIEAMG